jgi:two-component system, response regulator PdtaR
MGASLAMSTPTSMIPESQVSILHRVSSIVSSDLSLEEMLGEIVGLTVQVTGCDACLVYLIDHEANEMVLRASQVPHAADLGELRIKMGEGVTGWVAEHRSVVALPANASSDPRFKRFQALVEDTYEAFLSVPIVSGGEAIGVINVHHREAHEHSKEETSLLIFIGEQMGGVVSKARLMEEAASIKRQLEDRKIVERAKGILQKKYNTTEEDAYFRLRNQSRRLRRSMRELAEAVILAEDIQSS